MKTNLDGLLRDAVLLPSSHECFVCMDYAMSCGELLPCDKCPCEHPVTVLQINRGYFSSTALIMREDGKLEDVPCNRLRVKREKNDE